MEKLQMLEGVTERWDGSRICLPFLQRHQNFTCSDVDGEPGRELSKGKHSPKDESNTVPKQGHSDNAPRAKTGSSSIIQLMASQMLL